MNLAHLFRVSKAVFRENVVKPLVRSDHWPETRKNWLKEHDSCAACGGKVRLQVHHKNPFHFEPQLELDPKNLITLCMGPEECHLKIGHGDNFKDYNPNASADAAEVLSNPSSFNQVAERAKSERKDSEAPNLSM